MEDVHKLRLINKLKSVYRYASVDTRHESAAEHSWSSLLLADFFLSQMDGSIDRLKVYEMLMYHDLVEVYAGDTVLHPDVLVDDRELREHVALEKLRVELPFPMKDKFAALFEEFDAQETVEARFARAIDALDAEVHELDYRQDWVGWTKEFLLLKKAKYFEEFPEMKKMFTEIVAYLEENNYFDTAVSADV